MRLRVKFEQFRPHASLESGYSWFVAGQYKSLQDENRPGVGLLVQRSVKPELSRRSRDKWFDRFSRFMETFVGIEGS
jgi:hypothetical protein